MQGIARALQIFEHVANFGPIGVSDLSRRVGLPKSTTQRHLLALAEAGWIRSVGESDFTRWVVTPKALLLSQNGSREGAIAEVAVEFMTKLRDEIDETVVLQVPKTTFETTYIAHADSR
ncbi:helix-turn-helix domain-containing protein, partial [Streptomyces sp. NPDC001939]